MSETFFEGGVGSGQWEGGRERITWKKWCV